MDLFKKPNFGPAPPGYIPGKGRGAVPIFTRSDIGDAASANSNINPTKGTRGHEHDRGDYSDTLFDKWSGFDDKPFVQETYDQEDKDADRAYKYVDDYMDARRKRQREATAKEILSAHKRKVPAEIFADLKPDLATISNGKCNIHIEEWTNLPDAKSHMKTKKKKDHHIPISDRVLQESYQESQVSSGVVTTLNEAKGLVISSQIKKVSAESVVPSVDPKGYITQMESMKPFSIDEVEDLKKIRTIVKSLITTNPHQPHGWLSASRIEEKDGKIAAARKILREGCEQCPDSEDLWIESARLENNENAKKILAKAAIFLPKSVKIWLTASEKETSNENKIRVLKKGLELNPDSVRLWKEIVSLCDEQQAKVYLRRASQCIPHNLELWLAFAKIESYKNARAILNEARKKMPYEPLIWINAAKLEEAEGNIENIQTLIDRGIKTLSKSGVEIVRKTWLQEAINAEQSGSFLTAKAIIKSTMNVGLIEDQRIFVWIEDIDMIFKENCFTTVRCLIDEALKYCPREKKLWKIAIKLEKQLSDQERLWKLLNSGCRACSSSQKLWKDALSFATVHYPSEFTALAMEALKIHENSEDLYRLIIKQEISRGRFSEAQDFLTLGMAKCEGWNLWKEAIKLHIGLANNEKALEIINQAIEKFPLVPSFYIVGAKLFKDTNRDLSFTLLQRGQELIPNNGKLWIESSKIEEEKGNDMRARYFLEKGRKLSKDASVWIYSVNFENKKGNSKVATFLLSQGLQEFLKDGKLWSMAIEMANVKERKAKILQALEGCGYSPYLLLAIAKTFLGDQKYEKARSWFEKALTEGNWLGDIWIFYYSMEIKLEQKGNSDNILERSDNCEILKGEMWKKTKKVMPLNAKNSEIIKASAIR